MIKTILAAVAAGMILLASPISTQPVHAQATKTDTAKKPADTAKPVTRPVTPNQAAARDRQKKCGAEWKAAKAAGKVAKGMKWPQFWSACSKRLKGA